MSVTSNAWAGGFATAQFGGAHGNAASDSLTSLFYNPAGLALGDGTRAYIEGLGAYRRADYVRDPRAIDDPNASDADIDANSGAAKLRNIVGSPFAALATDAGQRGLALSIGLYVPFGGQAKWGQLDRFKGNATYPGALDGPQRWAITEGQSQSIFYTAAAAYRTPDAKLAFGVGLNVIQSSLKLTRARNATGSDALSTPDGMVAEGRSYLDVSNIAASVGIGFIAQPSPRWRVGISYQSSPLQGETEMKGTLENKFGASAASTLDAGLRQRLPASLRFAFEHRASKHVAWRGGADVTGWDTFEDQCIVDRSMPTTCQFTADGSWDPMAGGNAPLLDIKRDWHASYGLQGGGSWWMSDALELSANLRLDTNAIPDSTLEPAVMDANKVIGMIGARWSKGSIDLDVTLANVWYAKRTVAPRLGDPMPPSRNPDMAGTYEQGITFLLVGIGVRK